MNLFITIRILDVIDILLVALMLYEIYMLIKGTVAFNILSGFSWFMCFGLW
jgi:DNA integrity scanning protein DisA with diadenylate cyclase activity